MNVYFSGGRRGDHEAGTWQFWTVGDEEDNSTFRVRSDPERRVQDILNDGLYKERWTAYEKGNLRPANALGVATWMCSHASDCVFAALPDEVAEILEDWGVMDEINKYRVAA